MMSPQEGIMGEEEMLKRETGGTEGGSTRREMLI
jgi:hypothetical protein